MIEELNMNPPTIHFDNTNTTPTSSDNNVNTGFLAFSFAVLQACMPGMLATFTF